MKYLFLAYADPERWRLRSGQERAAFEAACAAHVEMLQDSGYLLMAETPHSSVSMVQVQHGQVSLTDGPLIQVPAQLMGLYVIDARDLNDAIRVASTMPQAHGGPIEVRPLISREKTALTG